MNGRSSSELLRIAGNTQDSAQFVRVSESSQKPVRTVSSLRTAGVAASQVPPAHSAGPYACRRIARAHLSFGPRTVRLAAHFYSLPADACKTRVRSRRKTALRPRRALSCNAERNRRLSALVRLAERAQRVDEKRSKIR